MAAGFQLCKANGLVSYFRKRPFAVCLRKFAYWPVNCYKMSSHVMMSFLSALTPPTRWQITPNMWFLVGLVSLALAAPVARAQTNTGFSGFTQSFNPAGTNILFTTSNARGCFLVAVQYAVTRRGKGERTL